MNSPKVKRWKRSCGNDFSRISRDVKRLTDDAVEPVFAFFRRRPRNDAPLPRTSTMPFSLSLLRADINERFEKLRDKDGLYGAYRGGDRKRTDLYSTLDVAMTRALMGENLLALPEAQRREWI